MDRMLKSVFHIFIPVLALLLWGSLARAAQEPLPDDCMPSDQIRPGMIGEGRTVFKGFKVETFKAEILGVQHNAMPGCNIILAKLESPWLEKHGVVAGMSGSPVYVNGKIIGAVAYGWSFAYQPYCGITPIEHMWSVWQSIGQPGLTEQSSHRAGSDAITSEPWDWQSAWKTFQQSLDGGSSHQGLAGNSSAAGFQPDLPALAGVKEAMHPLWSPLYLSGASPKTEKMLHNFFAARGIELMGSGTLAGSGGGSSDEPAPPIENGSALGVPILSGDLSLSGIGTVTYRKGDKLIAFGHPMFFQGGIAAPMAQAYIFGFMQSYERSFKLGDVREVIGTIDQDRLFAIGGKIGAAPARVPITVQISGPGVSRPRTYHFSCWKSKDFLPMMSATATQEAFNASVSDGGELTADLNYHIILADGRTIEKHFHESSKGSLIDSPLSSLLFDMFLLSENPFHEANVRSIDVSMKVNPGIHQDAFIGARLEHTAYKAGDQAHVIGRFRPWRDQEYDRDFYFDLPKELRPGTYVLHLADSSGALRVEKANHPERFMPRDFNGIIQFVQQMAVADDELRLYLIEPSTDINLNGYAMGQIPSSTEMLIQNTAPPQLQLQTVGKLISSSTQRMPSAVFGTQSLMVQVVDHFDE